MDQPKTEGQQVTEPHPTGRPFGAHQIEQGRGGNGAGDQELHPPVAEPQQIQYAQHQRQCMADGKGCDQHYDPTPVCRHENHRQGRDE